MRTEGPSGRDLMGSLSTAAAWEFTPFRWDHTEVQSVLTSLYKLQVHNEPVKSAIRHHLSCWIYNDASWFTAAVSTGFMCPFLPFLILILNRIFLNSRINKHLSKVADLTDEPILTPNPAWCFLAGVNNGLNNTISLNYKEVVVHRGDTY